MGGIVALSRIQIYSDKASSVVNFITEKSWPLLDEDVKLYNNLVVEEAKSWERLLEQDTFRPSFEAALADAKLRLKDAKKSITNCLHELVHRNEPPTMYHIVMLAAISHCWIVEFEASDVLQKNELIKSAKG